VRVTEGDGARNLAEAWAALRDRYEVLLVDRLGLDSPLREVATHALQGGKRLRPMLAEVLGRALHAPAEGIAEIGIAVEYLHTASLLLDDLPCMDGAVVRRGVEAAHVRFSQAEAILTAVALVSRSYALLLLAPRGPDATRAMALDAIATVATTMAPAQAMELRSPDAPTRDAIGRIHDRKTASLFGLLCHLVASCAGASTEVTETAVSFATLLGRAYQIIDDIEDRDQPGEARVNLARVVPVAVATADARERLAEARRVIAHVDATGELAALVEWFSERLDAYGQAP
jgi:geranylgeranyl diphosphate synthase type II